jgi:hypothetical protein
MEESLKPTDENYRKDPYVFPEIIYPPEEYIFGREVKESNPCIAERFFKNNPDARMALISCPCPKCRIYC